MEDPIHTNPESVVVQGGGATVTMSDLLLEMKVGVLQGPLEQMLRRRVAARMAEEAGIVIDDAAVEAGLSEYYVEQDLVEEARVTEWLQANGIDEDALRHWIRVRLLAAVALEQRVPPDQVERLFQSTLHDHDRVWVEEISFEAEGVASEILLALREGDLAWKEAVQKGQSWRVCELDRRQASESLAARLFTVPEGGWVGPVETEGGSVVIYRVLASCSALLDDNLRAQLQQRLFEEHLDRALGQGPPAFLM